MFELVLQKSIVFFRGNDVRALTCILTRSISLPFAPYPGLMLDIGAGPYEAISFITYHHENACFFCICEEARVSEGMNADALMKRFLDEGWELAHKVGDNTIWEMAEG